MDLFKFWWFNGIEEDFIDVLKDVGTVGLINLFGSEYGHIEGHAFDLGDVEVLQLIEEVLCDQPVDLAIGGATDPACPL
jgi:hypothetical protein